MTDVIFVGQQLVDPLLHVATRVGDGQFRRAGALPVHLAENIGTCERASSGRHVGSPTIMLTLFALLNGRTVQPSAFAFAWMPDRWSHHYRQQVRWFAAPPSVGSGASFPPGPLMGLVATGHRVDADLGGDLGLHLPGALASARHRWQLSLWQWCSVPHVGLVEA